MDGPFREALILLRDNPTDFEQKVLANELDVNIVDLAGRSILFYSNWDDYPIELLIMLGINLDIQDVNHYTWLHFRNFKTVKRFYDLIKSGKHNIIFNPNPSSATYNGVEGNSRHILQTWSVRDCIMDFFIYNHVFSEPLDVSLIPEEHMDIYDEYRVFRNTIYEIEIN